VPKQHTDNYRIGKARIYRDNSTGSSYWRVDLRRKTIPKSDQRRRFRLQVEAEEWAKHLNAIDVASSMKVISVADDAYVELIQKSERRINEINVKHGSDLSLFNVMETGISFLDATMEFRSVFEDERGKAPDDQEMLWYILNHAHENIEARKKVKEAPYISAMIDQFIDEKSSPVANRKKRKPISKSTLNEWKTTIDKFLQEECYPLPQQKVPLKDDSEMVAKVIDSRISSSGKNKGQNWSQQTKKNVAAKISQFGNWIVKNTQVSVNPWNSLNEFYALDDNREVSILNNNQVKTLFQNLAKEEEFKKLIPYYSLLLFAGLRPDSEVYAVKDKLRRFEWSQMQNWNKISKYNGILIDIPKYRSNGTKATKLSFARKAELIPAGVAWMKYSFESLPNKGSINITQSLLRKFKRTLPFEMPSDICRHTFSSNIIAYSDDYAYWTNRCGHSERIQKIHYSNPPNHDDATAFTKLTPTIVLDSKD